MIASNGPDDEDALRASIIRSTHREAMGRSPRRSSSLMEVAALSVGGVLTGLGLARIKQCGLLPIGLGLAILYEGLELNCLARNAALRRMRCEDEQPDEKVASNPVDEASWESFPASDPPTFTGQIT